MPRFMELSTSPGISFDIAWTPLGTDESKSAILRLSSGENVRNYGQFRTLLGDPGLTECLNAFRGKSSYSIYNTLRRRILKKQFRRLYFFFDVKRRFMKLFSGDMKKRVQSLIRKSSYKY